LKKRAKDFCTAVTEALLCSSNLDSHSDPIPLELLTGPTLVATGVGPGRGTAPSKGVNVPGGLGSSKECISCHAELKKKGRCKEGLEEGHAADLERVCQACYKVGTETGKLSYTQTQTDPSLTRFRVHRIVQPNPKFILRPEDEMRCEKEGRGGPL
jgi:hypothetical protein